MLLRYFVGVDISKETLDLTLLKDGELVLHQTISNTKEAIALWLATIAKDQGVKRTNTLFCMEHIGVYGNYLLVCLQRKKGKIWVESGLQIKRSLGIQRGKNDRLDSFRIATYCYIHQRHFKQWEPPRDIILQLRGLMSLRRRLINAYGRLSVTLKEKEPFSKRKLLTPIVQHCQSSRTALLEDMKKTEKAIDALIRGDDRLYHLYTLVNSVNWVGPVLATEMLVATNEFKNFDCPRKFACYCGVAPFEHTSGSSVRGKVRVSNIANKKIKAAFHMAAVASISKSGELRDYFLRKVGEGKPKMNALNAIRNKLIHRIFSCVRQDRIYAAKDGRPLAKRKKHFEID